MNKRKNNSNQAFTIVELLIVIVVIAILAAITIVGYSGIQKQAIAATVKNDLKNAAAALAMAGQDGGSLSSFPATVKPSPSITLTLAETGSASSFCINATTTRHNDIEYHYHSASGMAENLCAGEVIPNTAVGDTSNIPTLIAYDMFDRANSTSTLGTSPSGHTWTSLQGTWGIQSNRAYSVSAVDGDRVMMNVGTKDFSASIKFYGLAVSKYPALIFRVSGNTFYLIEEQRGEGIVAFKRIVSGSFQDIFFTAPGVYSAGDLLSIKVKEASNGSSTNITASVNGTQILNYTDTAGNRPQGTGVGFRHGAGSTGLQFSFDSLQVSPAN